MNCSKRILAFFLVLTLVVQVLPLSVFAEASNSVRATEQEIVSEETPGAEEETPAEETSTLQIANNLEEASEEAAAVPDDLNSDSSDETVSGNCGEDLSWEFSPKSGTLTIMGSGKMSNYDNGNQKSPWSAYASQIQSVEFPEGLTGIGDCCGGATLVTINGGLIQASEIGAGHDENYGLPVVINGGVVNVTGTIGGNPGIPSERSTVTINGGQVTAGRLGDGERCDVLLGWTENSDFIQAAR